MKLLDYQKEEILNGLLPLLDPQALELKDEMREIWGRDLINLHNVTRDKNNQLIAPGKKYTYAETIPVKINHRQRIGHIIADAANEQEMTAKLGEYLAKYAKDKNEVIQSIPTNVLLHHKNKNHDN